MADIVQCQIQAADTGYLQRVCGMTLCDKVRICEIRKTLNGFSLFLTERS